MREETLRGVPSAKWLLYSQKWTLGALAAVWSGVLLRSQPAGEMLVVSVPPTAEPITQLM